MYLYKPSSYDPERIGHEICYSGCLDRVKTSINSFFLKDEYSSFYMWRLAYQGSYTWSLHAYLEPSFKKLIKVKVL